MLAKWFREEIEACRPGSRDIDQPEMSQLADALVHDPAVRRKYEAVQQMDARVAEAFAAVPLPTGLAARLLSAVAQAPAVAAQETSIAPATPAAVPNSVATVPNSVVPNSVPCSAKAESGGVIAFNQRRWMTRRRLLTALAASVVLAAAFWTIRRPSESAGPADEAVQWYAQLGDAWQPLAKAPADLALPPAIAGSPRGWQAVSKSIARRGVAYEFTQEEKRRAVLFVMAARRPDLPQVAPQNPQSSTGGLTIGAWQSQGLVYVLVVEGDQRAYRRMLRPVREAIAWNRHRFRSAATCESAARPARS